MTLIAEPIAKCYDIKKSASTENDKTADNLGLLRKLVSTGKMTLKQNNRSLILSVPNI